MHMQQPLEVARPSSQRQAIVDDLLRQGYSIIPDYFTAPLITTLRQELITLARQAQLHAAHIGKDDRRARVASIRGDAIHWLNGASPAQLLFLDEMAQLQEMLNRALFLGLIELEAHFAHYPPETGYRRHLDSFQNDNLRRITIVVYLNEAWQADDGGELVMFDIEGREIATVPPLGGTLVCLVSEEIPHQVNITRRDRYSIAGWFRIRDMAGLPAR